MQLLSWKIICFSVPVANKKISIMRIFILIGIKKTLYYFKTRTKVLTLRARSTTYTATILRVSGCCTSCCENDMLNWNSKQTFKLRAVGSISHTNALWHKYNTPASSHRFHWCLCSACWKVWLEIRDEINNHLQGHRFEATHSASDRKSTAGKSTLQLKAAAVFKHQPQ